MLAGAYLSYGNYYYAEQENADKAIKILMENGGEAQGSYGIYSLGYAYEITKKYEDALNWYERGLILSSNTPEINATFKNQIGHVYDLQ